MPTMPRSPQATAHRPIAVSKRQNPCVVMSRSALRAPVRGSERIGVFVPAISRVRRDPFQLQLGPAFQDRMQLLNELEVLDVAPLALPAACFPTLRPKVDRVHAELAVRIEGRLRSFWNERAAGDQRGELHAVVGREGLVPPALPL